MGDPLYLFLHNPTLVLRRCKNHLPWGFLGPPARVRDPPANPLSYLLASRPHGSPALQWGRCFGDLLMASPPTLPFSLTLTSDAIAIVLIFQNK